MEGTVGLGGVGWGVDGGRMGEGPWDLVGRMWEGLWDLVG